MKKLIVLSIAGIFYGVSSCCGCGGNDDEAAHDTLHHADTTATTIIELNENFVDTGGYVNDSLAGANTLEELYGEQWDFCDCVVKNDSVNKALETNTDDAQLDLILVRMDEIDAHCKGMLTQPNTTPEQRDRHARKVRKCLKAAGIK